MWAWAKGRGSALLALMALIGAVALTTLAVGRRRPRSPLRPPQDQPLPVPRRRPGRWSWPCRSSGGSTPRRTARPQPGRQSLDTVRGGGALRFERAGGRAGRQPGERLRWSVRPEPVARRRGGQPDRSRRRARATWCTSRGRIRSVGIDLATRQYQVLVGGFTAPIGPALKGTTLYVPDLATGAIATIDTTTGHRPGLARHRSGRRPAAWRRHRAYRCSSPRPRARGGAHRSRRRHRSLCHRGGGAPARARSGRPRPPTARGRSWSPRGRV